MRKSNKDVIKTVVIRIYDAIINDPSIPTNVRSQAVVSRGMIMYLVDNFLNSMSEEEANELLHRLKIIIENVYDIVRNYG